MAYFVRGKGVLSFPRGQIKRVINVTESILTDNKIRHTVPYVKDEKFLETMLGMILGKSTVTLDKLSSIYTIDVVSSGPYSLVVEDLCDGLAAAKVRGILYYTGNDDSHWKLELKGDQMRIFEGHVVYSDKPVDNRPI